MFCLELHGPDIPITIWPNFGYALLPFSWLCLNNVGAPMGRKATVTDRLFPDIARCAVCLYASFFFHASITLMATVCRFFPSQLVGVSAAESGDHKQAKSHPLLHKRQTGLSIAYLTRKAYLLLTCSNAGLLFPNLGWKPADFRDFSLHIVQNVELRRG